MNKMPIDDFTELNLTIAQDLADRGLRSKAASRILGLLIASLISVLLAVFSTSTIMGSIIYFPQRYDFQIVLAVSLLLVGVSCSWVGITALSNIDGFDKIRVHKEIGDDNYPHILFDPIRDKNYYLGIKNTLVEASPVSLPALIPGTVIYFLNSLSSGRFSTIFIGVVLNIIVAFLILLSIRKEMAADREGRHKEVRRIKRELPEVYKRLENEPEVYVVLDERW